MQCCHRIYTTFSYSYKKQCNNTFIHKFMSLKNTFVTIILCIVHSYMQYKKFFTCYDVFTLPNTWGPLFS